MYKPTNSLFFMDIEMGEGGFLPLWRVFQSNIIKILESQSQRRMQACLVQTSIQHINCAYNIYHNILQPLLEIS